MKFFAKWSKISFLFSDSVFYCESANLARKQFSHSGDDWFHHVSMNVSQAKVATLIPVGQAFVVDSQKVQYGGVKIMHMHAILGDVV